MQTCKNISSLYSDNCFTLNVFLANLDTPSLPLAQLVLDLFGLKAFLNTCVNMVKVVQVPQLSSASVSGRPRATNKVKAVKRKLANAVNPNPEKLQCASIGSEHDLPVIIDQMNPEGADLKPEIVSDERKVSSLGLLGSYATSSSDDDDVKTS